jgi:type IV secretion system protein TrbG
MRLSLILLVATALVPSGCANRTPPAIAYDAEVFEPATLEAEPPTALRVVEVPTPLPLPGQMRTLQKSEIDEEELRPLAHVADQRTEATLEPTAGKAFNAITVYPFAEGALFQLYGAPEQVTDIALQPGETLTSVAAGDTVRWVVGDTVSGAGEAEQVHILVKPFAPDLASNLVILTDRRTYHLNLMSTEDVAMAAIRWTYPQDELLALREQNHEAAAATPVASGLDLGQLRFRYRIEGDARPWRPLQAFDDGHKVYIEFPTRLDQGEAPPLFVTGAGGKAELVNYRVRGNYYIVDRLFAAAELRHGEDPQQVIRILRTDVSAPPSPTSPLPAPRIIDRGR